jgi:soluble lytic murein transglycosylase-like protein
MSDIPVEIHIHIHKGPDDEAIALLRQLTTQGETNMATLADLTTEVQENSDLSASIIALLNGIAQQLRDAAADPAAIAALADQLDSTNQAIADAITANTTPTEPNQ